MLEARSWENSGSGLDEGGERELGEGDLKERVLASEGAKGLVALALGPTPAPAPGLDPGDVGVEFGFEFGDGEGGARPLPLPRTRPPPSFRPDMSAAATAAAAGARRGWRRRGRGSASMQSLCDAECALRMSAGFDAGACQILRKAGMVGEELCWCWRVVIPSTRQH